MNKDDAIKILNAIKMLMCRPDGTPISDGCEALIMKTLFLITQDGLPVLRLISARV